MLNPSNSCTQVLHTHTPTHTLTHTSVNTWCVFSLEPDEHYKGILLALERNNQSTEIQEWWIVDQPVSSLVPVGSRTWLSDRREAGLQLLVFSDKVSPPSLGFLAGYGYRRPLQTTFTDDLYR